MRREVEIGKIISEWKWNYNRKIIEKIGTIKLTFVIERGSYTAYYI